MSAGGVDDPRFGAALAFIGGSGARQVQVRFDEEQDPVVWVVYAEWPQGADAAGAMDPLTAALRLARMIGDGTRGAKCAHCGRPSGVSDDWRRAPPADGRCWFVFDPETSRYRRSCEGETAGYAYGRDPATGATVGRNDPCPCGSGRKWKRCHGAPGGPPDG